MSFNPISLTYMCICVYVYMCICVPLRLMLKWWKKKPRKKPGKETVFKKTFFKTLWFSDYDRVRERIASKLAYPPSLEGFRVK